MKTKSLKGTLSVPGDKSISHRALIFSSLVEGKVEIINCSPAADCASSADCLRLLGLTITNSGSQTTAQTNISSSATSSITVQSPGLSGLKAPKAPLFTGNSGTTIRLLSGLLAGQPFTSILDGDASIRKRPMGRILKPLEEMGASVKYLAADERRVPIAYTPAAAGTVNNGSAHAPFELIGNELQGKTFSLNIASAQVQTAILLAGLQSKGQTVVSLPDPVRDHTTRMFRWLEIPFESTGDTLLSVRRLTAKIKGKRIRVPADISSAAFMLVGAALCPGSKIILKDVGINEGRLLVTNVLKRMGADITFENERALGFEPVADIRLNFAGRLQGTTIAGSEVATGIDEIPILALCGALCQGTFIVKDAAELKHKESNRLTAIIDNLKRAGADIEGLADGFLIHGKESLKGGSLWQTFDDHRLAMAGMIAQLVCQDGLQLEETDSVKISYPTFSRDLNSLTE
jgi:3-phosphoshikimate 1-carboxyvinyltransferase